MSLFDVTEFPKNETLYVKPVYFKNVVGNHIVRILPQRYTKTWAHYFNNSYVACLREEDSGCPICERNTKIRAEFPKDFRNHGYSAVNQRFCVNILDRTKVIICPQCQSENIAMLNGKFNTACFSCGTILTGQKPAPLNKVKLLSSGSELFTLLNGFNESVLDENEEPIGLGNFDINLMCMQSNDRVKPNPVPLPQNNDEVEVPEDQLFDTEVSVPRLTHDEMLEMLRGVKIRDIYRARGNASNQQVSEEDESTAEDAVNDLFNTD